MSTYSFSIRTNSQQNLMYIDQHGRPTAADFLNLKRAYLVELEKLRPGFSIVNDQRELEAYGEDAMEVAKELVSITNRHGAARVIRIVPTDLQTTVTISSTLVEGQSQYASIRVTSPEEAEAALIELSLGRSVVDRCHTSH